MRRVSGAALADAGFVAFVRSAAALALIGASVALAVAQGRTPELGAFVSGNVLFGRGRNHLLMALVLGVAGGLALVAALYLPRGTKGGLEKGGLDRLSRAARLLAPLTLAALLPGLLAREGWPDTLKLAVSLSVFLLGLEPLFRLHFSAYPRRAALAPGAEDGDVATGDDASPPFAAAGEDEYSPDNDPRAEDEGWPAPMARAARALAGVPGWFARLTDRLPAVVGRNIPGIVVGAMALFYIGYMSFFTVRNHQRFNTFTWDLGQINNQFYNFLHGHPFRCTALIRGGNWSELRNHAEATMFFLLPVYALWPSAEMLLILQAMLLGVAGIFVYRIAARRVSRGTAVLLAAAYYLYPPLHGAQFFDIHFQPVAAAFMLAAIDCFDKRRNRAFAVLFALTILCREDISIGTAVFGLFLLITGHRPRAGLVILTVSLAYFVLLRFVVMPAIGPWGFADHYRHLFPAGEASFHGIIRTIVTNPVFTFTTLLTAEKLRYLLQILAPLAFLPLRRIHLALSILPGAYFTLLTTGYAPTLDVGYQYSGYFIPYIFPAAALALAAMARQYPGWPGVVRRRAAVATLVVATALTTTHWGAIPPHKNFRSSYGVIDFSPPTPSQIQRGRDIQELNRLVPRSAILAVSDREMPHVANRLECWNISTGFEGSDYILYGKVDPIVVDTLQFDAAVRAGYVKVAERASAVLLKRPGAR